MCYYFFYFCPSLSLPPSRSPPSSHPPSLEILAFVLRHVPHAPVSMQNSVGRTLSGVSVTEVTVAGSPGSLAVVSSQSPFIGQTELSTFQTIIAGLCPPGKVSAGASLSLLLFFSSSEIFPPLLHLRAPGIQPLQPSVHPLPLQSLLVAQHNFRAVP